jgi:hypothetical protein
LGIETFLVRSIFGISETRFMEAVSVLFFRDFGGFDCGKNSGYSRKILLELVRSIWNQSMDR